MENYMAEVEKDSRPDFEIVSYSIAIDRSYKELKNKNPNNKLSWGYEVFDKKLGYIEPGQLILIGGTTGIGKTVFSKIIARNVAEKGTPVGIISLENRVVDDCNNDLYYRISQARHNSPYPLPYHNKHDFMVNNIKDIEVEELNAIEKLKISNNNTYLLFRNTERIITLDELENIIISLIKNGIKLLVIDHLHYIDLGQDNERHDIKIERSMQRINGFARKYMISILLIAHYKKLGSDKGNILKPSNESFKDSISIAQVPNKVLHLWRDINDENGCTELIIGKNRGYSTGSIEFEYNYHTSEYLNIKLKKKDEKKSPFS